jgi:hypothetical protein
MAGSDYEEKFYSKNMQKLGVNVAAETRLKMLKKDLTIGRLLPLQLTRLLLFTHD